MHHSTGLCRTIVIGLWIWFGLAPYIARAAPSQEATVERVTIRGNVRIPESAIRLWISTREGDPYSPAALDRDVRSIFDQGNFEHVKVFAEDGTHGGKIVTFEVKERPIVQDQGPRVTLGLEIQIAGNRLPGLMAGGGNRLIPRSRLKVIDEAVAGDFTAVDVVSREETGAMRVDLFVIYNDTTKQEWWKDKKQKAAGSYLIHEGESVLTADLSRFGIEPIELSAIDARPVVIGPSERPYITNKTQSLEVVRLERSLDNYKVTLKNICERTIARCTVRHGRNGSGFSGISPGSLVAVQFEGSGAEDEPITVSGLVFGDGSFEGDAQAEALGFLAEREGQRVQAPSVLARIVQAMQVADADLPDTFDKLEAGLWTIPEAIDKQSALDLLKSEYPLLDDREVGQLYEQLKAGLYNARNLALSDLGQLKRSLQEDQRPQNAAYKVTRIRSTLSRLKANLEAIIAARAK